MKHSDHYSDSYFKWQGEIGKFGGWANLDKFSEYIQENYNVLDFGSGGGYLLQNIRCKNKMGIEINDAARTKAAELGVPSVKTLREIEDNWADLIISNNALEHTTHPLEELKGLYAKLKKSGKIVFVVPCESVNYSYRPDDINYHLYSWSPMCIGNLFNEAGFKVIESLPYKHKWPPNYDKIARLFGRNIFNLLCKIYARIETSWYQVRIIAEK